jgi:hypothetical protein
MGTVLRSILAVVAGFVVASVVMMAVETVNGRVLHPQLGRIAEGMTDREAIRSLLASAPIGAFLVVMAGWAIGSLAGGWLAARVARRAPVGHALVLGALLTLGGIANNLMVPPPLWFWITSLLVLLPAAYAGGRLGSR